MSDAPFHAGSLVQKFNISIIQVVCTPLGLLVLSSEGRVFTLCYKDPEPVSQIDAFDQFGFIQLLLFAFSRSSELSNVSLLYTWLR